MKVAMENQKNKEKNRHGLSLTADQSMDEGV
jgi:hypothetical protein